MVEFGWILDVSHGQQSWRDGYFDFAAPRMPPKAMSERFRRVLRHRLRPPEKASAQEHAKASAYKTFSFS